MQIYLVGLFVVATSWRLFGSGGSSRTSLVWLEEVERRAVVLLFSEAAIKSWLLRIRVDKWLVKIVNLDVTTFAAHAEDGS